MLVVNGKPLYYNNGFVNYSVNYNPLNLPDNTIRLKYKQGTTPTFSKGTGVLVDADENVWDLTYNSNINSWTQLLMKHYDLTDVLGANTTNIKTMISMFYACSALSSVNIFDTSNVTNIRFMFAYCSSINSIPKFDTHNVTNMNSTFFQCTNLTSAPLLNTENVTIMEHIFAECHSLTSIPKYNTSKVNNIFGFSRNCYSLKTIPLLDTHNVSSMGQICNNCSALNTIPLFDTTNVTNIDFGFYNCANVTGGALALYNQLSTQSNVSSHDRTFLYCGKNTQTGSAELAQIPDDWK